MEWGRLAPTIRPLGPSLPCPFCRWLPTLLCQAHDKICINAALGFDSYLVMRHGTRGAAQPFQLTPPAACESACSASPEASEGAEAKAAASFSTDPHLSCYFCSDVTAPGNSRRDLTLDQQCTVTRPGLSFMASALAAELLVGIAHNTNGYGAPAHVEAGSGGKAGAGKSSADDAKKVEEDSQSGGLGVLPHQIRGWLSSYSQTLLAGRAFKCCPACGTSVLNAFKQRGDAFITDVSLRTVRDPLCMPTCHRMV